MFTTGLVHRVILTVLLTTLLVGFGNCGNQQEEEDQNPLDLHHHHEEEQVKRQEDVKKFENLSSDKDDTLSSSPLSRSIPSFETRNYHDYYRNRYYRNRGDSSSSSSSSSPSSLSNYHPFESDKPSSQASSSSASLSTSSSPEMSTVISSTSYSIKPGSSGSGSNVYINTKATPIIITRNLSSSSSSPSSSSTTINSSGTKGSFSSYFTNTNPRRGTLSSGGGGSNSWDSDIYSSSSLSTDCFNGRNCPKGDDDDYKSYYSVLNGQFKYPERLGGVHSGPGGSTTSRGRYNDQKREPEMAASSTNPGNSFHDRHTHAIFPFNVHGIGPHERHRFYPNSEDDYPKRRVTRTSTTSSPSWVKLQPIPSHKFYDPFLSKDSSSSNSNSKYHDSLSSGNEKYENVQFANRIGIELSPENFAERWGYGKGGSHTKNNNGGGGGGGSRLPSWLEELNHHHKLHPEEHRRPYGAPHAGPTRDEDPQNWVKLDPIPVAGVSIQKWVPKGTASSDLPSTGNLIRDKPSAWWDHRHENKPPSMGWGSPSPHLTSSSFHNRYPSDTKRPNSDPWKDIIYPDTPSSATASWEAGTGNTILKGSSSFPSSTSGGGGGWKSDTRRPNVATWTAPLTSSASTTNRFAIHRPGSHHTPSNYPDPHAHDDDPRWVLVSNSRRVALSNGNGHESYSDRHKYRPSINGYRDDLEMYEPEMERERDRISYVKSHRLGKNYKFSKDLSKNSAQIHQDEVFHKVNETLQKLTPVLNHEQSSSQLSSPERRLQRTTASTTTTSRPVTKSNKFSFLSALIGDGRGSSGQPTATKKEARLNGTTTTVYRRGNSIGMKPILAAVGAGMIPATLAAVLPMMGKKRRRRDTNTFEENSPFLINNNNLPTPMIVHNQLYLIPSNSESRMNGHHRFRATQRHTMFQNHNIIIPR